jgi:type II secretory pathway pseudopilin PulG
MVAITATSTATPSLQSALNRSRVEQAQREADQAEANAQQLRAQASEEERKAQDGQVKVRTLTAQASQSDTTYTSAVKGSTSEVPPATQDFIERLYKATSQKFADSGNPLKTTANSLPVINVQGQSTGRIVNITA